MYCQVFSSLRQAYGKLLGPRGVFNFSLTKETLVRAVHHAIKLTVYSSEWGIRSLSIVYLRLADDILQYDASNGLDDLVYFTDDDAPGIH